MGRSDLLHRIQAYAHRNGLVLREELGFGVHGIVFAANYQTKSGRFAVKVHEREKEYLRERDVYLRLQEQGITEICGCHVPEMVGRDDQSWIIEMTMVARPFVLDFGGAHLDQPLDFPEEVLADWRADKQEQFGPRWGEVQSILRYLESLGIFMEDVHPGNISFAD